MGAVPPKCVEVLPANVKEYKQREICLDRSDWSHSHNCPLDSAHRWPLPIGLSTRDVNRRTGKPDVRLRTRHTICATRFLQCSRCLRPDAERHVAGERTAWCRNRDIAGGCSGGNRGSQVRVRCDTKTCGSSVEQHSASSGETLPE